MHAGQHLLSIPGEELHSYFILVCDVKWCEAKQRPPPGSPVSHSRPGALLGERSKQLFPAAVIPVSEGASHMTVHHFLPAAASRSCRFLQARHYQTPGFSSASAEHGQFSGSPAVHEPYGVAPTQHPATYGPGPSVPVSFASTSQIRGTSLELCMPETRSFGKLPLQSCQEDKVWLFCLMAFDNVFLYLIPQNNFKWHIHSDLSLSGAERICAFYFVLLFCI